MFCSNCGKQIPENTKFCSHCGAQQVASNNINSEKPTMHLLNQTDPISPPPAAPKKSKKALILVVVIAAVVITAVILGAFVIAPAFSGGKDLTPGEESSIAVSGANSDDNTDEISQPENDTSNEANPPIEKAEFKYKKFERSSDYTYEMICVYYREGSDYIAEITGLNAISKDAWDYPEDVEETFKLFSDEIESKNLPTSMVECGFTETADGLETTVTLRKLDEGNFTDVKFAVETILPVNVRDGEDLKVANFEEQVLKWGYTLVDEN